MSSLTIFGIKMHAAEVDAQRHKHTQATLVDFDDFKHMLPRARETLELSSIAGWHYWRTSRALSVTKLCPLVQSMKVEPARTAAVRLFPASWIIAIRCSVVCRTLYCASCSLCRMPLQSYLDGIMRTPLATHPRSRQVQRGMPGSPVAVRASASLLGRLLSRVRQHSALSAVSWRFDLHGTTNTQQLWRQNFCSRGTSPVELSSSPAA